MSYGIKSIFPFTSVHDSYQQVKKDARDFSSMLATLGASESSFRRSMYVYQRGENVHPFSYVPVPQYDVTLLEYLKNIINSHMNLTLSSVTAPRFGVVEQVHLRVSDITLEEGNYVFHTQEVAPSAVKSGTVCIPVGSVESLLSAKGYHLQVGNFHYDVRFYFQAYSEKLPYSLDKDVEELEVMYRFVYATGEVYLPMTFSRVSERTYLAALSYSRLWEYMIDDYSLERVSMEEGLVDTVVQFRDYNLYMSFWDEGVRRNIYWVERVGDKEIVLHTETVTDSEVKTYIISDLGYTDVSDNGTQAVFTTIEGISFKIWLSNQVNPEWKDINPYDVIESCEALSVPFSIYMRGSTMLVISDVISTKLALEISNTRSVYLLTYEDYLTSLWFKEGKPRLFYRKEM